ncbi:ABC transporter permease [Microbaculum marinum]|uniref:ABC transporter permease n=1 Tax=Microbaculum marinum TaxID=1764581 RepID=A0AAW9S377_9HYPH
MTLEFLVNWLASMPVAAAPLLLAALGLIISERAGVLNLSAEGLMLAGALAAAAFYQELGSNPWLGMLGAFLAGAALSVLFAVLVVVMRANQVVSGLAIVFFAIGLTSLLGTLGGWTDTALAGFSKLHVPVLSDIPVVGPVLFRQDPWVYLTVVLLVAVTWVLFRTNLGLKLRSVGHNPHAVDSMGIDVLGIRFAAVVVGGGIVGLAGGYLVLASAKIWVDEMTNGRGWIAIALVIFAGWHPWRALLGALIFGGIEALIPRVLASGAVLPQYYVLMTPYIATLVVLVWAAVNKRDLGAPRALGMPFVREDRR